MIPKVKLPEKRGQRTQDIIKVLMPEKPSQNDDYTVADARNLARSIKYGPSAPENSPTPSVEDALEIIHADRKTCGFNWITAETAMRVLSNHLKK